MGLERLRQLFQPTRRLDITFKFNDAQAINAGAVKTYTSIKTLPAGSKVLGTKVKTTEGFTGDTTAIVTVGKAGATDDFFGATQSVLAAGDLYGQPATLAEGLLAAATAPLVTITSSASAAAIAAGRMTVSIYYEDLNTKAM